jgi:hypothetical protein
MRGPPLWHRCGVASLDESEHWQPSLKNYYTHAVQPRSWITPDDLTGDIERMIGSLVMPYVDYSNPLMHVLLRQACGRRKNAART